ncbi:MAG: hypothetical protein AAFY34_12645 [Pseudomonadota bacterium]
MKIQLASAMLALAALGGCVIIDADDADFRSDFDFDDKGFGSVYGADVAGDAIAFTVSDNGCTDKTFFDVRVFGDDEDEFEVGVKRVREDYCRALNPDGKTFTWTFQELGIPSGAEVTVLNSVRR